MIQIKLLLSFIKIGLFGFGGGQSMIPLIEDITVKQYGFITQELFLELVATANVLPGPIGTNLAVCHWLSHCRLPRRVCITFCSCAA